MHDVVLIINDLNCGGTERVYATLANAWAEQERKVCVITQTTPDMDFHKLDPRVTRLVYHGKCDSSSLIEGLVQNLRRMRSLRSVIRQAAAPVAVPAVAPTAILVVIASWGLGTRVVVAERNDPARQSYGRIWDFLRRLIYRRADLVTANSRGALDSLSAFVPTEMLRYLPNPVVPPRLPEGLGPRRPVILNVARMYPHKAQKTLIDAFAAIADKHPSWRLAIAGEGPLEAELKQRAAQRGLADRVDWLGVIDNLGPVYAEASAFVLPSHNEGMPNALLEAMWAGLAVVVSDASPGPLEVVDYGNSGLVFPVDDVDALAQLLERIIGDADLRQQLGEAARERLGEFELDNVLRTWEAVLGLETLPAPAPAASAAGQP